MWRDSHGKKKEKRKTGKEKGGWKKGSLKNSKFFKLPRQCQNELGVCLAWECVYGSARVRVHGSLFMSLCVWLTTLLQECTMTEWELAAGPIPLRIHRKNPLQLTSRLWQTHTYYALKLRRAGEHMAASLIPLRQCAFVSVCVCVCGHYSGRQCVTINNRAMRVRWEDREKRIREAWQGETERVRKERGASTRAAHWL